MRCGDIAFPLLVVRMLAGCDEVVARHSRDTSPSDRCSVRGWSLPSPNRRRG